MEYQSKKRAGWFSNRYQTAEAHIAAKERKIEKANYQLWCIDERAKEREERGDKEQLKLLDKRLGKGIGAKKERARLKKRIDASG